MGNNNKFGLTLAVRPFLSFLTLVCFLRSFLGGALDLHVPEQAGEEEGHADPLLADEGAAHEDGGDEDAEELARRRDQRQRQRPELIDGQENEELPERAAQAKAQDVRDRGRVRHQEPHELGAHPGGAKHVNREKGPGEEIHPTHHVQRRSGFVRRVDLVLVGVRESVKGEVDCDEGVAGHEVGLRELLVRRRALLQRKNHQAEANERHAEVLLERVALLSEDGPHDHHRNELARLHQHLG
mmetsp:Transcript_9231/g.23607  ORF Transcript_9231/g.23607 Transcript_9231/m.23607 type:complete len:241 (+) Transcript_9231:11-733(+)